MGTQGARQTKPGLRLRAQGALRKAPEARARFLGLDAYRVGRERARYEGTPQRELFRALRARFLARHPGTAPWAADLGSGPGRFSDEVGPPEAAKVLLDLSQVALLAAADPGSPGSNLIVRHRVRGDAARPPLRGARFGCVALLGNVLGFSGGGWRTTLSAAAELLSPSGVLLLEAVAGPGERSRYLHRLPAGAVARAVRGPARWVQGRIGSEGFARLPARAATRSEFVRIPRPELGEALARVGLVPQECLAVAPALGSEIERIQAVARDPAAWDRLLALEETLGRDPARWEHAAAYLVAASRPTD